MLFHVKSLFHFRTDNQRTLFSKGKVSCLLASLLHALPPTLLLCFAWWKALHLPTFIKIVEHKFCGLLISLLALFTIVHDNKTMQSHHHHPREGGRGWRSAQHPNSSSKSKKKIRPSRMNIWVDPLFRVVLCGMRLAPCSSTKNHSHGIKYVYQLISLPTYRREQCWFGLLLLYIIKCSWLEDSYILMQVLVYQLYRLRCWLFQLIFLVDVENGKGSSCCITLVHCSCKFVFTQ